MMKIYIKKLEYYGKRFNKSYVGRLYVTNSVCKCSSRKRHEIFKYHNVANAIERYLLIDRMKGFGVLFLFQENVRTEWVT